MKSEIGSFGFNEARLVVECSKMYFQDLDPDNFIDDDIMGNYSNKIITGFMLGK